MKILIIRAFVLFIAIPALTLDRADQALAQTNCNAIAAATTVDDAYKLSPVSIVQSEKPAANPDLRSIQLDDVIVVKVTNLEKLYDNACQNKSLVLFLNDQPIKSLNPYPPTNPSDNILKFILRPTEASKSAWRQF